jgi:hypothetical protein
MMDQRTADSDDEAAVAAAGMGEARKPYLQPQLVRLGTLADMTRTVGGGGAADGSRLRGRNRTSGR